MPTDHNIRQLVINKMTDAQYEQAVKSADELYLTPDSGSGGGTDLPDQTGQSGKFLTTNGSTLSWGNVPAGTVTSVRVQAGTGLSSSQSTAQSTTLNTTISIASGYKLPTTTEWNNNALPSQSGNEGKFLTTNGSTTSWADASIEIDNSTIVENSTNQIQAVGVKDVRTDNTIKTWTGTKAQYDALIPTDWTVAEYISNLSNSYNWRYIIYGDTKFIALSQYGYISTSTDGTTWSSATQVSNLSNSSSGWRSIAYDGNQFVALDANGYISTSTNGTTWSVATQNANLGQNNWFDIAYDGNQFVALASTGYISTSTNGTTWTTAVQNTNLGDNTWYSITYDGNQFIALGNTGYISTSTDGTTWSVANQNTNLGNNNWRSITYDGNQFVALGNKGYISTSTNGTTWSVATQNANLGNHSWISIAHGNSKFVALGFSSYISVKSDSTGADNNTLYNIENYGLYLGSTEIANVGSGGSGDLPDPTGQSGKFLATNGTTFSWETPPQGTVTSVRVQTGTGLSSSQSTAQSSTLNTTISIASGYKLPTTTEWSNKQDALPSQTGQSGKYLTTNGTTMSWATVQGGGDSLPDQTGNAGKFLTTNGTTASWVDIGGDMSAYVLKPATIIDADNTDLDIEANTIYRFRSALTSLTLSSIEISDYESVIYFSTGNSISFTDNSNIVWSSGTTPSLETNTAYCIAIRNGFGEIGAFGSANNVNQIIVVDNNLFSIDFNEYVQKPTIVTNGDNTGLDINANTVYKFGSALTTLTLSSFVQSDYESIIYFSSGSSISFIDNSGLIWKCGTVPSLEINTKYIISICNGMAVIDSFGTTI